MRQSTNPNPNPFSEHLNGGHGNLLLALTDAAQDAIVVLDDGGRIVFWNPAAERIFGYSREQACGRVSHEWLTPERFRPAHHKAWPKFASEGAGPVVGKTLELDALRADGQEFPIELSVSAVQLAGRWYALGIVRDISERKQAQERLRQAMAVNETLLENMPVGVVVCGQDKRVRRANATALKIMRRAPEEVIGHPCHRNICPAESGHCPVWDLGQSLDRSERAVIDADGRQVPVLKTAVPITLEGEALLLEAFVDISELKAAERELALHRDHLEQLVEERSGEILRANRRLNALTETLSKKNAELQEFAYIASHDLREPVRKIHAFGERLAGLEQGLDERHRDYLQRMLRAAVRMEDLIDGLLRYSRIVTQGGAFEPVDLDQVLAGVLEDLEVALRESGGRVESGPLGQVRADPLQMRQLLQNLVANAVKFHRPEAPPRVRIARELPASGQEVLLTVSDNGVGFEPQQAEQMFQMFKRLHGRSQFEGSGIGLALCRRIVERHGGRIEAHGRPGEGSRFRITLPLHPDAD